MSKISDIGWGIVNGRINGAKVAGANGAWTTKGRCLSFARQVADYALGFSVYAKYGSNGYPDPFHTAPIWAKKGLSVNNMMPGDLLMQNSPPAGVGHVGIFMGKRPGDPSGVDYVLENTEANRGLVVHGPVRLTPLAKFGRADYIIRFPQDTKSASDTKGTPPAALPAPSGENANGSSSAGAGATGVAATVIAAKEFVSELVKPVQHHDPEPDKTLFVYNAVGEMTQARAPGAELTHMHGVHSMVILRKPAADELESAMPFLGPLSVSLKDSFKVLQERFKNIEARIGRYESWGRYYQPIYDLANPDAAIYRWPLPGITSLNLRQSAEGSSVAEVEMQIDDHEAAEMILSSLNMAQRYKNLMVEIWMPVVYYDDASDKEKQRMVLEPMFTGMIQEVSARPWPHNIHFRVIPQDQMMNNMGLGNMPDFSGHFEGKKTIAEVIGAIGNAYKMLFYAPSVPSLGELSDITDGVGQFGLSGIPELQAPLENFDTYMQPPLDVVKQLVEQRGLKMYRMMGFELFGKRIFGGILPRAIFVIYNPATWNPFTKSYWDNAAWSKIFKPLAEIISPGHEVVGNLAVFYPYGMAMNPKRIKLLAGVIDTFASDDARRDKYAVLFQNLMGISGEVLGLGPGSDIQAAYETATQSKLVNFLDDLWGQEKGLARVTKAMCPVLEIEDFTTRTPSEAELANPLYGTDNGTGSQTNVTTAAKAAKLMNVTQQPDGSFHLFTQDGEKSFQEKDQVYLKYIPNMSRPYSVSATPIQGVDAGRFYPHTLTVRVKPTHGVRPGMMAAFVGFGRIDGVWEVYEVSRELDASNASMTVTLRCMRDLYLS